MGVTVIFILVSGLVGSVHAGSGVQCLNCHHSHDFPDCLLHHTECKHHEQCIVTKENQNVVMVHCGNIDECYHNHAGQTKMCCITQKCLADQLTNSGGQSTTPLISGLVGSVHAGSGVQCLNCHHSHDFPDCLLHYAECKHHEQCVVTKENQNVVMVRCGNIDECYHNHAGQTKMCCITQKCLADQLTNSGGQSTTPLISTNGGTLGCPSHCQHKDFYQCITQAAVCPLGEFCEYEVNDQGVKGGCHSLTKFLQCENEASKHTHCPAHYSMFNKHHCRFCCIDQSCKIVDFLHPTSPGPATTTPMSTTTPMPATTPGPATTKTPTTSAISSYKCQDSKSDCVANMATVCKDEAGILQCSQTCGLCALVQKEYNGTDPCDDQMLHGDCVTYAVTNNMCTNSLAPFLCPHQCGLCDKVMSSLAQQVLNGGTTSTTSTTPVPTTTSPATSQCVDTLQGMSCASFPNICANSFGPVSCRKFCNLCGVTTTP